MSAAQALGTARLERRSEVAPALFKAWLRPSAPLAFKPGQYCTIGAKGIERPYSICSAPAEELLELFVETIPPPAGQLTPLLDQLQEGDQVTLRPRAKGLFTFKPAAQHHFMVSTVTGVAPFISMLRHLENLPEWQHHQFHLLQGASYSDEFGYDQELAAMAQKHPNVHYVQSVSRPGESRNKGWRGKAGRVNAWAMDYIAARAGNVAQSLVYLCGHPLMIEDMRAKCANAGVEALEERFWAPGEQQKQ